MKNFREIEQLSAYLDGQFKDTESAKLEQRLQSDPELVSVLSDLRAARSILRKLPKRRAPRNFTLTRQMVGLKPPLPRFYPVLRLATVFAAILFVFSFSMNALSPYVSFFSAPQMPAFGFGGGGGCEEPCGSGSAAEEPAAEAPMLEMAPQEETVEGETARAPEPTMDAMQTPKDSGADSVPQEDQVEVRSEAPVSTTWLTAFLIVTLLGASVMWFMRQAALRKWR